MGACSSWPKKFGNEKSQEELRHLYCYLPFLDTRSRVMSSMVSRKMRAKMRGTALKLPEFMCLSNKSWIDIDKMVRYWHISHLPACVHLNLEEEDDEVSRDRIVSLCDQDGLGGRRNGPREWPMGLKNLETASFAGGFLDMSILPCNSQKFKKLDLVACTLFGPGPFPPALEHLSIHGMYPWNILRALPISLISLELSHYEFPSFKRLKHLKNLRILRLKHIKIVLDIEHVVPALPALQELKLDLTPSLLHAIDLRNLERSKLRHIFLRNIPRVLGLPRGLVLKSLRLHRCSVLSIKLDEALAQCPNLQTLELCWLRDMSFDDHDRLFAAIPVLLPCLEVLNVSIKFEFIEAFQFRGSRLVSCSLGVCGCGFIEADEAKCHYSPYSVTATKGFDDEILPKLKVFYMRFLAPCVEGHEPNFF